MNYNCCYAICICIRIKCILLKARLQQQQKWQIKNQLFFTKLHRNRNICFKYKIIKQLVRKMANNLAKKKEIYKYL